MEYLNTQIIFNVWLAMMVYNILFKAFGSVLLNAVMKGKAGEEVRKSFQDRLKDKSNSK